MNPIFTKLIRQHYIDLKGYVSAGMQADKSQDKIFLNANENPYELPGMAGFNRYPEPQPKALLQAYAGLYDVRSDQIIMTCGADEGIDILLKLFVEPHTDSIVISAPTFGMYAIGARALPADVVDVPLLKVDGTYKLDVAGLIAAAQRPEAKLVFVCSPNNPTATSFDAADIQAVIEGCAEHAVVVLDETYIELAQAESLTKKIEDYPHLVVLRTLSKSYSMAGLRMGALISADTDFIELVRTKALRVYPLPVPVVQAVLKAFEGPISEQGAAHIEKLLSERARLEAAFKASEKVVHVYPSDANFLLVEFKDPAGYMQACAAKDIILRDFSLDPATKNCLRISVGTPEQNDLLINVLSGM